MTAAVETKAAEPNVSNELARERTRDASERTMMAWIRTSFSLISFGFGIPALIEVLADTKVGQEANLILWARILGFTYISLGVFAVVVAMLQHRRDLLHLEQGAYSYQRGFPLGFVVAGVIALIGVASFLGLMFRLV